MFPFLDAVWRRCRPLTRAACPALAGFLALLPAAGVNAQNPPVMVTLGQPDNDTIQAREAGATMSLSRDSTPERLHHMVVHLDVSGTAAQGRDYELLATDLSGRWYSLTRPHQVLMVPAQEDYSLHVHPLSGGAGTVTIDISQVVVVPESSGVAAWTGAPVTITIGSGGGGGPGGGGDDGGGNGDDDGGTGGGGTGGGGTGGGGDDDGGPGDDDDGNGDDDPDEDGAERLVAPYWHGTGGFTVRPTDGLSATVRVTCGRRSYSNREFAGEDGLIVRLVRLSACLDDDGRPLQGEMTFEGAEQGGWYWVDGLRNVAVAPLVRESSLNGSIRPPIPAGVTARPVGDQAFFRSVRGTLFGTLIVHDHTGFMAVIPHLEDLEGAGEHMASYWAGSGGIVGRPLNRRSATVRLSCLGMDSPNSYTFHANEDGLVVELLADGCYDADDEPVAGRLEVDGLEDGAWYWINGGRRYTGPPTKETGPNAMATAAPLVRRDAAPETLTVPVIPPGPRAAEGDRGTLFLQGRLMGVVPRVRRW